MYNYFGFGLKITSDIEFPELLPFEFAEADVTICKGAVPRKLEGEGVVVKPFSFISNTEYILKVHNVCNYYAGFGQQVRYEPVAGVDDHSARLFLLGTVMAAVIYQRGNIPLHASAILKNKELILFAGNSGAGKSTLLAQLATRGHTVFTDDICVVEHGGADNKVIMGAASYPMLKLWEDAMQKIESNNFTREFKIRPKLPKYGQFFYEDFQTGLYPVAKIFILSPHNRDENIKINPVKTVNAFKKLEKQAYKFQMITSARLRALHFRLISQLVNEIPVYEVTRPVEGTSVASLSDAIEQYL